MKRKFPLLEKTRAELKAKHGDGKCPHCKRSMELCSVYDCHDNPNRFNPNDWILDIPANLGNNHSSNSFIIKK